MTDLDAGDRTKVCEDVLGRGPEPGEYDCGDNVTVTIEEADAEDQAECEDGLEDFATSCPTLTVGEITDCFETLGAQDPCADDLPPECDAFFECLFGGL